MPELTRAQYRPRGGTPLLDAFGDLITRADQRLARLRAPEDQVLVVFTDGHENASGTWSWEQLFSVIKERKKQGWVFTFMGANQDSYTEAGRLGFDPGNVQNFRADRQGARTAMTSISRSLMQLRSAPAIERRAQRERFYRDVKEAEEQIDS